jgi:GMP synthase (glutamine-hydrolysing)
MQQTSAQSNGGGLLSREERMSDILVLQHVHTEPLGTISDALDSRGLSYRYIRSYDGEDIPADLRNSVGLIVMGGPMGVYEQDRYPFLTEEMKLIELALERGMPVLGVCLGSQLLAAVLGAEVKPGPAPEVGWATVALSEEAAVDRLLHPAPAEFMGFHWHGDIFDLPAGAELLAASEKTECQAFRHGNNAYGFLFHMEVNDFMVRDWTNSNKPYLAKAGVDVDAIIAGIPQHLNDLQHTGRIVFGNWADLATRYK